MNNRFLRPGESDGNNGANWSYAPPAGGITSSTADVLVRAAQAGKRNYITKWTFSVGVVLSAASEVVIKDGAATVLWRVSLGAAVITPIELTFDPPLVGSVNTAVNMAMLASVTGNFVGNLEGYTA